ncbi:hypothetical protein [Clostridium sp.]
MKRISHIILVGCIIMALLLSACSIKGTNKNNLIITNKSSEIISNIAIQSENQTDVMGSKLAPKEQCYFEMGIQEKCNYKVEFEEKNKQVIHSNQFTSNFNINKDEIVKISILKDSGGKWVINLEN